MWLGGLALPLLRLSEGITGITLSEKQHAYVSTSLKPTPQARYIHYELRDYQRQTGHFNKVVSIGMLEHVAATHLNSYFASIARLLALIGIAFVHSIDVGRKSRHCNKWINEYIFPREYLPGLERVTAAASHQG